MYVCGNVTIFSRSGANINHKNRLGKTALHYTVANGNIQVTILSIHNLAYIHTYIYTYIHTYMHILNPHNCVLYIVYENSRGAIGRFVYRR